MKYTAYTTTINESGEYINIEVTANNDEEAMREINRIASEAGHEITLVECEPEQPETETAEADETETEPETATTNEEEIEMSANYNYLEETEAAVLDFVAENVNREDWTGDRDGLENHLHDECWIADSVTGNASGSYFCNSYKAAEALNGNLDLLAEALEEFGSEAADYKRALTSPEWADVTIRCYILSRAVSEVCEMLEESGYFEESEADESDIIAVIAAEIKTA